MRGESESVNKKKEIEAKKSHTERGKTTGQNIHWKRREEITPMREANRETTCHAGY